MPKTKKETHKTKLQFSDHKEGEYSSLTGIGVPTKFNCFQCKAKCTGIWDVCLGKHRFSFCSGKCAYRYLVERNEARECKDGIELLEREFGGKAVDMLPGELEHMREEQGALLKKLRDYEIRYYGKSALDNT